MTSIIPDPLSDRSAKHLPGLPGSGRCHRRRFRREKLHHRLPEFLAEVPPAADGRRYPLEHCTGGASELPECFKTRSHSLEPPPPGEPETSAQKHLPVPANPLLRPRSQVLRLLTLLLLELLSFRLHRGELPCGLPAEVFGPEPLGVLLALLVPHDAHEVSEGTLAFVEAIALAIDEESVACALDHAVVVGKKSAEGIVKFGRKPMAPEDRLHPRSEARIGEAGMGLSRCPGPLPLLLEALLCRLHLFRFRQVLAEVLQGTLPAQPLSRGVVVEVDEDPPDDLLDRGGDRLPRRVVDLQWADDPGELPEKSFEMTVRRGVVGKRENASDAAGLPLEDAF